MSESLDILINKFKAKNIPSNQPDVTLQFNTSEESLEESPIIKDLRNTKNVNRSDFFKPINKISLKPDEDDTIIDQGQEESKEESKEESDTDTETKLLQDDDNDEPEDETKQSQEVSQDKYVDTKPGVSKTKTRRQKDKTDIGKKQQTRRQKDKQGKKRMITQFENTEFVIGDTSIKGRLKRNQPIIYKAPKYYLNNRQIFINYINSIFEPYKQQLAKETDNVSCDDRTSGDFSLMTHQQVVLDYMNLYTPYRGVLLYHGLGSGKTCSSIAIAEGLKDNKQIIVMTPASLQKNYYEELKKCGDILYKKNQYWEQIQATSENVEALSFMLNLSIEDILKKKTVWVANIKKPANYSSLNADEKSSLDAQLDLMIRAKYKFISYNGLRKKKLDEMQHTESGKINPFNNSVVIIDEAHNLVSRIVNKIGRRDSISIDLYELLMSAENARIVMLSGTPIINYPNELAILFNILRGYINTWNIKLSTKDTGLDLKKITDILNTRTTGGNVKDYIEYNSNLGILTITRNPFGFVNITKQNKYAGVVSKSGERFELTNDQFIENIKRLLKARKIKIIGDPIKTSYTALPDKLDDFKDYFIDAKNNVFNTTLLKKRIVGLTSYYRSAQESLMPSYDESKNFHIIEVKMSDFQFGVYEKARVQERKIEKNKRPKRGKADDTDDSVSTYRIFSRAFCNFVFPAPDIIRPIPNQDDLGAIENEDLLDTGVKVENIDGKYDVDELGEPLDANSIAYDERIQAALSLLDTNKSKFLTKDKLKIYSPKFLEVLEKLSDPDNLGMHLIYSQFRSLEGIAIFKLVLIANGYAEFNITNKSGIWTLDIAKQDIDKPKFVLYTGTESVEKKEILRNIYNGDLDFVPTALADSIKQLDTKNNNNLYGDIIKIFMITASGAEGISLKNTRFVHIMEPYWHPVRIKQVIGRARRICSHKDLPKELQTVDVYLYLMTFTDRQLKDDATIELRINDISKLDKKTPYTSDQALYEISMIKQNINANLLTAVKESAIDCALHSKYGDKEQLNCFNFNTTDPDKFSYSKSISTEETDQDAKQNIETIKLNIQKITLRGVTYAINMDTNEVYDYDSYLRKQPIQIGILKKNSQGQNVLEFI